MAKQTFGKYEALAALTPAKIKKVNEKLRFNDEEQALCDALVEQHARGFRAIVDGVVDLKAAERKEWVQPYVDLGKKLVKTMRPKSSAYVGPLRGMLKAAALDYDIFIGWLKNRQKYKDGELLPPASHADLVALTEALRDKSGDPKRVLPSALCESFLIVGGMASHVRTHPEGGFRLYSPTEIVAAYDEMTSRFEGVGHLTPISGDGCGNVYAMSNGRDVHDINHEDGSVTCVGTLPKMIKKAHKVSR